MFSLAILANHMPMAIYKWNYGNMAQWPQHIYKHIMMCIYTCIQTINWKKGYTMFYFIETNKQIMYCNLAKRNAFKTGLGFLF